MPPAIATVIVVSGILGLFWLDRDPDSRTSKALWIPVLWLLIACSRPVSLWLNIAPSSTADQQLDGSPVDRFIFTLILIVGLAVLFGRARRVGALLKSNLPIVLFFSYCALSILWSDYPDVAFKRWTKDVGDLAMVLIVLTELDVSSAFKRTLARTGFVLIPVSLLLIKYYPDLGRTYSPWSWVPVPVGVTTNKNTLGMTCLLLGLGSVWRFLETYREEKSRHRTRALIAHGTLLIMVFWLLWIANSATSFSCFILASGLMVAMNLRLVSRKLSIVHLLVASEVALAIFALFADSGGGLLETVGRDPTLTGRTEIWHQVLDLQTNPLFGTGFESCWLGPRLQKMWSMPWWHPNEAHDGYIEVFLNLGWTGIVLLGVLIATGYRNAIRSLRSDREIGKLRLAYFVVVVIYNCTESAIRIMNPVWIFFLMIIIDVPKAPALEDASAPLIRHREQLPVRELQAESVLHRGLRQERI